MVRTLPALLAALVGLQASVAQAQVAGTLVSADPVTITPPGMQAWRIAYATRGPNGASQVVTGMVAPRARRSPRVRRGSEWRTGMARI